MMAIVPLLVLIITMYLVYTLNFLVHSYLNVLNLNKPSTTK